MLVCTCTVMYLSAKNGEAPSRAWLACMYPRLLALLALLACFDCCQVTGSRMAGSNHARTAITTATILVSKLFRYERPMLLAGGRARRIADKYNVQYDGNETETETETQTSLLRDVGSRGKEQPREPNRLTSLVGAPSLLPSPRFHCMEMDLSRLSPFLPFCPPPSATTRPEWAKAGKVQRGRM